MPSSECAHEEAGVVEGGVGDGVFKLLTRRKAVDDPIQVVSLGYFSVDPRRRSAIIRRLAKRFTGFVGCHLELEGRGHNPVAEEDAAQALGHALGLALGTAEVKRPIVVVV